MNSYDHFKFHEISHFISIVISNDGLCLWHAIEYQKFSQQAHTYGSQVGLRLLCRNNFENNT